ncbi:MAG TPA: SDR family oxidoreductase [Gaiellaceae bacterium]|jgi:rhamnose utilization protein RhaD (predicted bifunctional aldolase and dehydrogenase)/NAD(P)-dependent dehydrogenase (short-subunit alcohol dehydrogenase family)|nr:SDR family oxidoreductase [Gaiellaceae bacterium]
MARSKTELERLVARSRLIGADPALVLHGGGNTSTKLVETDHLGRDRRVLRIKGSGSDLATAGAGDFPGLWLDDLMPLRDRDAMSDEEMVAYLARCLVEPEGARPSIETLLHAFLPAAHVDHVHADAICSLANAPDPAAAVRDALGPGIAVVPYLRPGFELSKRVSELAASRAVVLAHHGLVTWGESHEESHGRTLELVGLAQDYLGASDVPELREPDGRTVESFLVRLRGRLSREQRQILGASLHQQPLADRADVEGVAAMRSTPDHMLRIGPRTCVIGLGDDVEAVGEDGEELPRTFLVPGFGAIAAAPDIRAVRTRLELAEHSHSSVASTFDRFGGASWLTEAEVHDFQNWPLELYKLTLAPSAPELAGHIAIVTGAASGIGRDVAVDLAARGAHLVLADLDAEGLEQTCAGLDRAVRVVGDLTDAAVVDELAHTAVASFGGLDSVVFNAGVGSTGELSSLPDAEWRRSLDVNLTAQFQLTKRALALMTEQAIGGSLVYVASKNAFAPGAGFGPYSVAKAGLVQLMRIAALEGGEHGIRANAVNPDAIFAGSKLWSDELRRERAEAHGVEPAELESFYASRSLLGRTVTGADVAEAVAFLASERSRATTGCVIPVDGGVPGAFPR